MQAVRGVLGSDVGPNEPLMDAGLDSLGAVEFKNAIAAGIGVELPVTAHSLPWTSTTTCLMRGPQPEPNQNLTQARAPALALALLGPRVELQHHSAIHKRQFTA